MTSTTSSRGELEWQHSGLLIKARWSEADHPRAGDGKFTDGGGEPSGAKPGAAAAAMTPAAAKAFIDSHYGSWRSGLKPGQEKAIRFYQSPGYALMNGQLRGTSRADMEKDAGRITDDDLARAKQAITNLKAAIKAAPPLKEPVTVYRGFSAAQFGDLQPGQEITDPGFVSTALTDDAGAVSQRGGGAQAVVRLPAGTKAAAGSARELILPPGSRFKVVSVGKRRGKTHVELELQLAGTKGLLWRHGGLEYKARRLWRETDHPRDAVGKFTEIGATVRIAAEAGGGLAKVEKYQGGGWFVVTRRRDNQRLRISRERFTVVSRPDGSKPTANPLLAVPTPPTPAAVEESEAPVNVHDVVEAFEEGLMPEGTVPALPEGGAPEPTKAQLTAQKHGWKTLPSGTLAELQTQLAAVVQEPVPSVLDLIDGGMEPEKAAKERKRLRDIAYVKAWRQRMKIQAAIDNLVAEDTKAGPDPVQVVVAQTDPDDDPAVVADLAVAGTGEKPKALYDPKPGGPNGPGGSEYMPWFDRMRFMTEDDAPIPVAGLTVGAHRIERGWAVRKGQRAYLVEQRNGETPEQAMVRLDSYEKAVNGVMGGVPLHLQTALSGLALMAGPNPSDAHWATQYNMPGFVANASGGNGQLIAWNGEVPKPTTIAHEFGHNLDSHLFLPSSWLSDNDQPVIEGQQRAWKDAQSRDALTSKGWQGRFNETRLHDWVKPVTLDSNGVTEYGSNSPREDFAESVRLYLKDKKEGKVGYDPTTGDNLRFSDLFPERAKILDAAFHVQNPDYNTAARNRRYAEAQTAYLAKFDAHEGTVTDPDAVIGTSTLFDTGVYGLPEDMVNQARVQAYAKYAERQEAAKKAAELAAAAAAAKGDTSKAEAAKQVATIQQALAAGLLSKTDADKLRQRRQAAKYRAKKKGHSEVEAEELAAAYERTALRKWLAESLGPGALTAKEPGSAALQPEFKLKQRRVAGSFLTGAGKEVHPLAKQQHGKAQQAKANIAAELASRLDNPTDWELFRQYRKNEFNYDPGPYDAPVGGRTRQQWLDEQASAFVGGWASTSGDSSPNPVRMQVAIGQEFGIDAHPAPRMDKKEFDALMASTKEPTLAFMRRFARVQYEHTQEELAKAGITEVSVYRGMKFFAGTPDWAQDGAHRPRFQPANSWSARLSTSKKFGSTMFRATIPVALILGSARTGFGCLNEAEFVILDADGQALVAPSSQVKV